MKLWKRDGIYQYRFQVGGVRVQRSTGTSVKGQAETIALKAWNDAKDRKTGTYIPTLSELRENWLRVHADEVSLGHWSNVEKWDPHGIQDVRIDRLSTELVEMARGMHREGPGRSSEKRADATVAGWMRILNLLVNWGIKRGFIQSKPYNVPIQKAQKKPKKILPLSIVKDWLAAVDAHARNPQVGMAVRLMIGLGLRESEALGSRWEWIDWESKHYTPGRIVGGTFRTKGKTAVPVDIPDWLYSDLLNLRGDAPRLGLILPWKKLDKDGNTIEVPHPSTFTRASMRAANKDMSTAGVTAHRLRGTWITHHLRRGTPLKEVQAMARHAEESTTNSYYEAASEVRKKAQEDLAKEMGLA